MNALTGYIIAAAILAISCGVTAVMAKICKELQADNFELKETLEKQQKTIADLLRYSEDHREFPSMMNWNQPEGWYTDLADNIEQNGIFVCGFTVVGSGDEIRGLAKAENISGIYVEHLS